MATTGERLKELRSEMGITQKQLAKELGISRSALSLYEIDQSVPDDSTKILFAKHFNVTIDYLCGYSDIRNPESLFKTIDNINLIKIPIIKSVITNPPFSSENIEDYIFIHKDLVANGTYFFVKICDDSMINARIILGDLALIKKQTNLCNNDIILVIINNTDITLRRVIRSEKNIFLIAENPRFDPLIVTSKDIENDSIRIIGKVIEVRFNP